MNLTERLEMERLGRTLRELMSTRDAERDAASKALQDASAMVATKDAAIDAMAVVINDRDATIERVRALLDNTDGPLWAARGVREADIRTALGMPS